LTSRSRLLGIRPNRRRATGSQGPELAIAPGYRSTKCGEFMPAVTAFLGFDKFEVVQNLPMPMK
jgi:hypothetical protein